MKAAPKLQRIITQLAQKHGVDLDNPGAYLRLELPGYGQLVIESIGAHRISIANYVQVHRDWVADPEIVVYVDRRLRKEGSQLVTSAWIAIEVTELMGGWRLCAEPDARGDLVLYDPAGQIELADFAEQLVARNLAAYGWLEQGQRSHGPVVSWTPDEIRSRDIRIDDILNVQDEGHWPEPTVDPPDFETLEAWMVDDGCCEATDGCIVEPDGRCPHGHPSWLLKFGLI